MSRFDLIYLVLDKINDSTDRKLARHLIALFYENPPQNTEVCWLEALAVRMVSGCKHRSALLIQGQGMHA